MCLYFDVRDDSRCTLSLRKSYYRLWTLLYLSYKRLNAGFVSSSDVNWWTGVLWCFYQTLILTAPIHSDGTHSLTAVYHISPNLMKQQPPLGWTEKECIFIFGKTIALKVVCFVRSATSWLKVTHKHKRKRMSFIGRVCLHIRGICYSDRSCTELQQQTQIIKE